MDDFEPIHDDEDDFEPEYRGVYTSPAASSIAEGAKWALGRVGAASDFVDEYTAGPVRSYVGQLQAGKGPIEAGMQPYDYEKAPTTKQLFEGAGLSGESTISNPWVMNPFDKNSEANKLSPAGIAGAVIGTLADPTLYMGVGGISKGAKIAGEGADIMAGQAAKSAGHFAEERAAKASLGSNIAAYRDAARMPTKGIPDTKAAVGRIRGLGRTMLDDNNVGWLSTTEKIGQEASVKLPVIGEIMGEQSKIMDALMPSGAVSGQTISDKMLDYASKIPETEGGKALREKIQAEAANFANKGNFSVDEATKYKNMFKYKPMTPDLLISNQDVSNAIYGMINGEIEASVDKAAQMLAGIDHPVAVEASKRLQEFKRTKEKYGQYKNVATTATDRAAKDISNRIASPTDYGMGIGGALMGGAVGGDLKSVAIGAGLGVANKVAREVGPSFAAKSADSVRKMLQSNPERFSKWGDVLGKAAATTDASLNFTHHLLMNNDDDYKKAVAEGLTNVQTEPFKTIGNAMDTAQLGNVAMAGAIILPAGIINMLKKGNVAAATKFAKEIFIDVNSEGDIAHAVRNATNKINPGKGQEEIANEIQQGLSSDAMYGKQYSIDTPEQTRKLELPESVKEQKPAEVQNLNARWQGVKESFNPSHIPDDPFTWSKMKSGAGKNVLKAAKGKEQTFKTSSDLIAHDDYMAQIDKKNHTVEIHIPKVDFKTHQEMFPGIPSPDRLEKAAGKLEAQGYKVKRIYFDPKEGK